MISTCKHEQQNFVNCNVCYVICQIRILSILATIQNYKTKSNICTICQINNRGLKLALSYMASGRGFPEP